MSVSARHILQQGPVLASIARAVTSGIGKKKSSGKPTPPTTPGPEYSEILAPRPDKLVTDYIRHVGGDTSAYKGIVPFHLFPQWGFPILSRTLTGIPYDLISVMNAGCAITINHQIPRDAELRLNAHLKRVDATDKRVILTQRMVTECDGIPNALIVEQSAFVALGKGGGGGGKKREKPRVPSDVKEVGRFRVHTKSGLEFAMLTGDFNPLHWVPAYARAFGHPNPILHGFSTMARALELMNRNLYAGDVRKLKGLTVRFTNPLRLPADVGVYIDRKGGLFVGKAPNGPAYLTGTYQE